MKHAVSRMDDGPRGALTGATGAVHTVPIKRTSSRGTVRAKRATASRGRWKPAPDVAKKPPSGPAGGVRRAATRGQRQRFLASSTRRQPSVILGRGIERIVVMRSVPAKRRARVSRVALSS